MLQGEDLSSILFRYDESEFAFTHFENLRMDGSDVTEDDVVGQITPNSILEDPLHYNGCSGSSQPVTRTHHHRRGSEASELPKRKKGGSFFPQIMLSLGGNRRKGAPHRSPLA
jgi:hypothetical protein